MELNKMSNRNSRVMPPPRPTGRSQANDSATVSGVQNRNLSHSVTSLTPTPVTTSHHMSDRDRASSDGGNRSIMTSGRSNYKTTDQNESVHGRGTSQFHFTQLATQSSVSRSSIQSRSTTDDQSPSNIQANSPDDNNMRTEFTSGTDDGMQTMQTMQRQQSGAMPQNLHARQEQSSFPTTRLNDGGEHTNVNRSPRNIPNSTQGGHRLTNNQVGRPSLNGATQSNVKGERISRT